MLWELSVFVMVMQDAIKEIAHMRDNVLKR